MFAMADYPGSLIAFQRRFGDDRACAEYLSLRSLAGGVPVSRLRPPQGLGLGDQGLDLPMRQVRQADLGDLGHHHARQ